MEGRKASGLPVHLSSPCSCLPVCLTALTALQRERIGLSEPLLPGSRVCQYLWIVKALVKVVFFTIQSTDSGM